MAPRRIPGSAIFPLKYLAKTAAMSGLSQFQTRYTTNYKKVNGYGRGTRKGSM
jgi:hypothetical protein